MSVLASHLSPSSAQYRVLTLRLCMVGMFEPRTTRGPDCRENDGERSLCTHRSGPSGHVLSRISMDSRRSFMSNHCYGGDCWLGYNAFVSKSVGTQPRSPARGVLGSGKIYGQD